MLTRRFAICAALASATASFAQERKFPDVVAVKVRRSGRRVFDFDVTLASPYDTAERYADAFRVGDGAGRIFGERVLLHDHKDEQPFTRDLYGVAIPEGVSRVVVQGRDMVSGYGGRTMEVSLPD
jgi:hypothetical protein